MLRNLRNFVMAGLVLGLLAVPAFSATTAWTYSTDFNTTDTAWTYAQGPSNGSVVTPFTVTGTASSHLSGGTDSILGPFGNPLLGGSIKNTQMVKLTLTGLSSFDAITLNFQLWAVNSWDGNGQVLGGNPYTPDYFQVAVGGAAPSGATCTGSALCTTFGEAGTTQQYPGGSFTQGAGNPGGTGAAFYAPTGGTYFTGNPFGTIFSGYGVYNIDLGTIYLGGTTNTLTIYFRGLFSGTLQNGTDESWALSNVNITGINNSLGAVPEPSTIALGGLGLALLALAKMRSRKA